jgi:hypothetical protein
MTILEQLASDNVLDSAYELLCRRRRYYSANADVWMFRRRWPSEREQIKDELRALVAKHLPVSRRCTHLKGHGGAKYAVLEFRDHLPDNRFVLRSDVKAAPGQLGPKKRPDKRTSRDVGSIDPMLGLPSQPMFPRKHDW